MTILYLLLPLSLVFVLLIGASLCWAIFSGQYDAADDEGAAIFRDEDRATSDASAKIPCQHGKYR